MLITDRTSPGYNANQMLDTSEVSEILGVTQMRVRQYANSYLTGNARASSIPLKCTRHADRLAFAMKDVLMFKDKRDRANQRKADKNVPGRRFGPQPPHSEPAPAA